MTILVSAAPADLATHEPRYQVRVAADAEQVRAAQRLRHRVFAQELGAVLPSSVSDVDTDGFDAYCDHLIIELAGGGEVVGTYRMLPPGRSPRLYADGEFDLAGLAPLREMLVEAGRACVHPDHRGGAVINLMWSGIARYLHLTGYRWLAGCASVPLGDGGVDARHVWELAQRSHLAPPAWRVRPLRPYPVPAQPDPVPRHGGPGRAAVPALLRGYQRLGAWICGPPAHDPDFAVADFFVLLALDRIDGRYLRHFLGQP